LTRVTPLPFAAGGDDLVALTIVDLGVARAFWEGVPAVRLLARIRLHRDEHDLVDLEERASGIDFADASWDMSLARIVGGAPAAHDRIKRGVARHARAASDEGALPASDAALAALIYASVSATDDEASPAEGAGERAPVDEAVARACARLDERLGANRDLRAPVFEACLELATRGQTPPHALDDLRAALDGIVASSSALYPWGDTDVAVTDRRACLLERSDLERFLMQTARRSLPANVMTAVTDASTLLLERGSLLLVAEREPRSNRPVQPLPHPSWLPADLNAPDAPKTLATALERGATTAPRVRALLLRGGDPALDAAGKEMLQIEEHPFASEVFAEILAAVGRERDVVRLVGYFAIAPDPAPAARALAMCTAREVPTVLRGWLESTPRQRLEACLEALRPYPNLYDAVKSLTSAST